MKDFLTDFGTIIVILAAWFGFKSIRRMVGIARGRVSRAELSPSEIDAIRKLNTHPAFGGQVTLAMHGKFIHSITHFLRRWLIYFPLSSLTNIVNPMTWILIKPIKDHALGCSYLLSDSPMSSFHKSL
jgi:hypothetical protein